MFGSSKAPQGLPDRQTYIPPHIQGAMAEHVQTSMPAHLQKYRGGNAYIPEHAQREMTQHLENNLPAHMKEYAGAYMQQHVVEPSLARRGATTTPAAPTDSSATPPHAPSLRSPIQTLSGQPSAAPDPAQAVVSGSGGQPQPVPPAVPSTPVSPSAPAAPNNPDQQYQFITNPGTPLPPSGLLSRFSGTALPVRIGLIAGGALVLLILFIIVRGLFSSSPGLDSLLTVAQEQQELIHLVSNTDTNTGQQDLSVGTQNLAATMQASLASTQSATINYMALNGKKINAKQLNLKVSAATDTQLSDAAAAGTYNRTFREVIEARLTEYGKTLSQAYDENPGPKGQALLKDSYKQLQLFQVQLKETASQ